MKITEFIQKMILLPRLMANDVLVVYDPDHRYQQLCLDLDDQKIRVINVSYSSITTRLEGLAVLQDLSASNAKFQGLLVYVPVAPPVADEEKQIDPFSVFSACGAVFPESDGDEYLNLCLRAKPDHATEIRGIFANNPDPSFEVIDAVGGGGGWPTLQAELKSESSRDMLFALLVPNAEQKAALEGQDHWIEEARDLLTSTLGLELTTRIRSLSAVSEELWRFLLFSEFTLDLSGDLPGALETVPHAPSEAGVIVYDLCERLRNDRRTQVVYLEFAEQIERDLQLPQACKDLEDLGSRDTFPFEERVCFAEAVKALQAEDVDFLRESISRHQNSVWAGVGENQQQWTLIQAASNLVQACSDAERELRDYTGSVDQLIDYYLRTLREVDRFQREFEEAQSDYLSFDEITDRVREKSRRSYRALIDLVQSVFINLVEDEGWPVTGRLFNTEVFDQVIAPAIQESGRKVAMFQIDAVRYELGVELIKQISSTHQVDIKPACAQLPTTTAFGMVSILPGAGVNLRVCKKDDRALPVMDGQEIKSVKQRMDVLQKQYGQRFREMKLSDFVSKKRKISEKVDLLVLRSSEMDNDFETNPEAATGLISRTFQKIQAAVHKLQELGFVEAFIVTDHGFYINTAVEPGDKCNQPNGNWIEIHGRMLLGDGTVDESNLVLPAEKLGIQGDFSQAAVPKALVSYRAGQTYFHGGLSLQESIVPVISIKIHAPEPQTIQQLEVELNYKHGAERITTRIPVIEIIVKGQTGLFEDSLGIEVVLEAHDQQGNIIGEAKPGGVVDPATRILTLQPGAAYKVPLKMDPKFEGKFTVKLLDPMTMTARGNPIELETDYMV